MAKKVLIVDDDEFTRSLLRDSLKDEDVDLFEATDGEEALEMVKELKPALIIMDVMMPGKSGYTVCEEIRQEPGADGIHVIFLSARETPPLAVWL